MGDILFTDFDKITDTILYLSNDVTVSICLNLNTKSKDGKVKNFHSEYKYYSDNLGKDSYSIKRTVQPYFSINDLKDFKNSIMLKVNDIWMLKILMDNKVMPWFIGKTRLFFFDENNKLQIKGKYDIQEFRLNEYNFMAFAPIVIRFEDGTDKEGIRLFINSKDRFVDMTIDIFISFYYLISNTDLYNAGANMLNYVKMSPYDCGLFEMGTGAANYDEYDEWNSGSQRKSGKGNNFFNKL
jgi:hypothetical protein